MTQLPYPAGTINIPSSNTVVSQQSVLPPKPQPPLQPAQELPRKPLPGGVPIGGQALPGLANQGGAPGSYRAPSNPAGAPGGAYGVPANPAGAPGGAYGVPSNPTGAPGVAYGVPSSGQGGAYVTPANPAGVPGGAYGVNPAPYGSPANPSGSIRRDPAAYGAPSRDGLQPQQQIGFSNPEGRRGGVAPIAISQAALQGAAGTGAGQYCILIVSEKRAAF